MLTINQRANLIALAVALPLLAVILYLLFRGNPKFEACREYGIAFHQAAGDYPTIRKTRERALAVVEDLCRRTTDAYPKPAQNR